MTLGTHLQSFKMLFDSALIMIWLKEFAVNVKRNGKSGSPRLSPLEAEKKPLGDPSRIIEKWAVKRHPNTYVLQLAPKPFRAIT